MARKREQYPQLRFRSSLSRLGLGIKPPQGHAHSTTTNPSQKGEHGEEEDWYIPYNGPYEPPPSNEPRSAPAFTSRRNRREDGMEFRDTVKAGKSSLRGSGEDAGPQSRYTGSEDGLGSIFGRDSHHHRNQHSMMPDFGETDVEEDESEEIVRGDMDLRARYGYSYASSNDEEIDFDTPLPSATHPVLPLSAPPVSTQGWSSSEDKGLRPRAISSTSRPAATIGANTRRATVSSGHGGIGEAPVPALRTGSSQNSKPGAAANHVNPLSLFHLNYPHHHRDTDTTDSTTSTSPPTQYSIFTASPPQTYSVISSPPGTGHGTVNEAFGRFSRDSNSVMGRDAAVGNPRLSLASLFGGSLGFKGKGKEREGKVPGDQRLKVKSSKSDLAKNNVGDAYRVHGRPPATQFNGDVIYIGDQKNMTAADLDATDNNSEVKDARAGTVNSLAGTNAVDNKSSGGMGSTPSDGDDVDADSEAYYNTYYATLLSTPTSARGSSFRSGGSNTPRERPGGSASEIIPPLPLYSSSNVLPSSQYQLSSSTGRISPRVDMGGFGRRHGKSREKENLGEEDIWNPSSSSRAAEVIRSEAEDERGRGRPATSRSRQPVHPYANVRAFTFPSSPEGTSHVDETDPATGSPSRPPKLTFTAPSQHSSPLSVPHTHPTAHLHLQTHPHLLPPPPHSDSPHPHPHSDSQENYSPRSQRRPISPQSKPNSPSQAQSPSRALLLPHPLQHLHNIRNRLKMSMSTPNLRAFGSSASASGSLSGQSSRSSAASTSQKPPHTRNPSKSKAPEITRHVPRPINIIKQKSVPNSPNHVFPRGLDRWLSAETWCDALFLPKPRLRLRGDDPYYEKGESIVGPSSGSRRIVSPPGSPVARDFANRADGAQTLESRVLAHSRSLADLRLGHQEGVMVDRKGKEKMAGGRPATADASGSRARGLTLPSSSARPATANPVTGEKVETSHPMPAPAVVIIKPSEKPSRPKSWALDDLALPSPVPSLMTVLAEGQILEHQRRKWQAQAQKSFQNQRSRSLSRSRSKSVSKKGKGNDAKGQSSHGKDSKLEYLAARSLLGNQDILPISTGIRKRSLSQSHTATDSTGRPSGVSQSTAHRPSHSFSQTMSKSTHSRNGSQNHSRNGSWSKTALDKIAMGTAALCGIPGGDSTTATPETEHPPAASLERALRSDTTQVIRLADPATILPHPGTSPISSYGFADSSHGHGTAEGGPVSVEGVGIAISTPGSDLDRDSIRLPDHPYAQTVPNVYHHTYMPPAPSANPSDQRYETRRGPDPPHSGTPDISSRHPFAHQRDSYQGSPKIIGHPRPDSEIPPQATMWAPVAAGVVREVLPEEFRYSPIVNNDARVGRGTSNDINNTDPRMRQLGNLARNSRNIFDTVALGETLAMAVEDSRDHLSRISEGYDVSNEDEGGQNIFEESHQPDPRILATTGSQSPRETHREPVQYDASRPMHRQASLQIAEPEETYLQASPSRTDILPELESRRSQISRDTSESSTGSMPPTSPVVTSPITSESSSPRPSPRLLSHNSDDLEHFRDLFYRPDAGRQQSFQSGMSAAESSSAYTGHVSWDANIVPSRHRTASSGLTSLVRRVGEELEELNMLVAEMGMELGDDSASIQSESSRPRESRFVIAESSHGMLPIRAMDDSGDHPRMQAFRPSTTIPEDVEGSAEGEQLIDDGDDEDLTARFRIGVVEAVPTPPSTSEDRRFSQHLSSYITHPGSSIQRNTEDATVRVVSNASLQPPSTVLSRVSYMTSSDGSRMSGLSDFPVPPLQDQMTPGNMSIVDSYFEDVTLRQEFAPETPMSRQSTLGGDEEVDFAMAFSSRPHTARPQS